MAVKSVKLYNPSVQTTNSVSFEVRDEKGELVALSQYKLPAQTRNTACFSALTYETIPKAAATVIVIHPRDRIPYDKATIQRWIEVISDLGFPCSVAPGTASGNARFTIDLKQYRWKMHLTCVLMLIRVLYETGLAAIPGIFFELLDADPRADLFDLMQTAHKVREGYTHSTYGNTNHCVTYDSNGSNVTRDELFARIEATDKPLYGSSYACCDDLWNGDLDKVLDKAMLAVA